VNLTGLTVAAAAVEARLLLLDVNGKVARLTLVLDVLKLWVDHVSSHRGDRLTPRA